MKYQSQIYQSIIIEWKESIIIEWKESIIIEWKEYLLTYSRADALLLRLLDRHGNSGIGIK